ncbi:MAG: phosphotransferase [Sedimenticola sp.]
MNSSVIDSARRLMGDYTLSLADTQRGGNSTLSRLLSSQGYSYAVKQYPAEGESGRERLEREQAAYLFFAANGCREVPRQLAVDSEHRLALFEWLEGGRPAADDISALDAMVGFLSRLHALRKEQAAAKLADAKDAVFSLDELIGQLQRRIATFAEVAAEHPPLQHHMQEIVIPAAAALVKWAGDTARAVGIDSSSLLEPRYRTLSPSDVGSHNMLKTPSGYRFIDFEYFGWDDPTKLIGDFVWRPEPVIDHTMKAHTTAALLSLYGDDPGLESRYHLYGPLLGFCWGLILLNPLKSAWAEARGITTEQRQKRVASCISRSKALVLQVTETVGVDVYALEL